MKMNPTFLFLSLLLFIVEVLIAIYAHDDFVRPYVGDFLVVILLYCMVKSFLALDYRYTAFAVLAFSYLVEGLQYLNFVDAIGLGSSRLANILLGNYFAWIDILAYTLGIILVLIIEYFRKTSRIAKWAPAK